MNRYVTTNIKKAVQISVAVQHLSVMGCVLTLVSDLHGDMPVIDPTHISVSARNSALDYVQQAKQIANQVKELKQLAEEIHRLDEYLERFGNPKEATLSEGGGVLLNSLENRIEAPESSVPEAEIYDEISASFAVDDGQRKERDPHRYKPERVAEDAFNHYREIRTKVMERRQELRAALSTTMRQLQSAETASEVEKLVGVLMGIQTELTAVDRDLEMATQHALLRVFENENHRRLENKARAEEDESQTNAAMEREAEFFRLPERPVRWSSNSGD